LNPSGARVSPSTARNRDPILRVLEARLPAAGMVLEIAAGAGEHAVHAARALPGLQWQPTDADPEALARSPHGAITQVCPICWRR
jgi:hypothetical protein